LQNDRQYEIAKPYAQTAVNWLAIRAALHFIGPPLRRSHTPEEDADPVREFTGYLRDFQKVCPVRRQKSARLCAFPRWFHPTNRRVRASAASLADRADCDEV